MGGMFSSERPRTMAPPARYTTMVSTSSYTAPRSSEPTARYPTMASTPSYTAPRSSAPAARPSTSSTSAYSTGAYGRSTATAPQPYWSYEDDMSLDEDFSAMSLNSSSADTPVYTMSVSDTRVCIFEPAREEFLLIGRRRLWLTAVAEHDVYHAHSITKDSVGGLSKPSAACREQYVKRDKWEYGSPEIYRELILPGLLLGSRVRDFEQRCAVVEKIGPVVLTMPPQNGRLKELKLKTIHGTIFSIAVKSAIRRDDDDDLKKRWTVFCHPPSEPLPKEVKGGAMLEIQLGSAGGPGRVTTALMRTHANQKAPIDNWNLLSAIYGACARRDYPAVSSASPFIRLAKGGVVNLNPEQAEAVARYNCDVCPAFVVESPPGSGKTMTAAAMAVSYKGPGTQLFLSTANVPVINMALALSKLDIGFRKPLHFISSEREELLTDETRSPYTILSMAKASNEELNAKIESLEAQIKLAPIEEKDKLRASIQSLCTVFYAQHYDIFFATIDMIIGRLFKNLRGPNQEKDNIKKLLKDVRRVVVDEASQLTEAALNALILCFPNAQIVLIGDSKQLPPFKFMEDDVVSSLAARSALEVVKAKKNLPVIKLNRVYRASPNLMKHYSNVFYEGALVSLKPESKNLLSCFGARSGGSKCLYWKVKGQQKQDGTSKINYGELRELKYLINILRASDLDEKDVMIISYYEAQRKKAEEQLESVYGEGYEVLTVDSAQGREKKIVIVLTTRTSVPIDKAAFFSCPLRCNVAVSRHQEALIVLGHNAISEAPHWSRVLSPKYFKHVEPLKYK